MMGKSPMRKLPVNLITGFLGALCVSLPQVADAQDLRVIPAETFLNTPGGVDMRTGRYVYTNTDLAVGEGENAFSLERILPDHTAGHANPFGNFSHNWDIRIVERMLTTDLDGTPPDNDIRMTIHMGGRAVTFEAKMASTGHSYKGSGPIAFLSVSGDRTSPTAIYTLRDADGSLLTFRAIGSGDCSDQRRCAFVSSLVRPDGTRFDFSYVATGKPGTGARLARVASSRGQVLVLEGTGNLVSKACIVDTRSNPAPGSSCPVNVPATSYQYVDGYQYNPPAWQVRLASMTDPAGQRWGFTYAGSFENFQMGFVKPGQSSPWLVNTIRWKEDEELTRQEITDAQSFADGRSYTYSYSETPATPNRPVTTIMGGIYTDNTGAQTAVVYDFPVLPGGRQGETCTTLPCLPREHDEEERIVYQSTPGPVEITDALGRTTRFNYCDPVVAAGLPSVYQDRCAVIPLVDVTDPEGGKTFYKHDAFNNILSARQVAKPGSGQTDLIRSATYDCSNPASCTKPVTSTDAKDQVTHRTYAPGHGGLLSEMQPAPSTGAARPLKLVSYVQRFGWARNPAGTLVQSAAPMWVIASETQCQTVAGSNPPAACDPAAPQLLTIYEYGANGTGDSLLVKGLAVTADGETRRTCYGYDAMGRRVSETRPQAGLASCL